MAEYYDWEKTISYDADVTMVIGARGLGKTFGLRKQCINDFLKRGWRFCEIVRYKNELYSVADGYFNRLQRLPEFDNYMFKTDSRYGYIAKKTEDKPAWKLIMYFVALTDMQKLKKQTFDNVRRMIFDEGVLERSDRYHHYLPNEFTVLANMVDTVSRERADTNGIKPRVYILGNACDISNPYFAVYKVETDLQYGYHWYAKKTFLLHYVSSREYAREKGESTVAGRMLAGTDAGRIALSNEFVNVSSEFVEGKSRTAKFSFGVIADGRKFGVWADAIKGRYYITDYTPNNTESKTYYLTAEDGTVNYLAASKAAPAMRVFSDAYYMNILRYDTIDVKMGFMKVLQLFGIR